jgi:hypothetical protein
MPVVAIVDGVKIQFYFSDHLPMHFHVEFAGERAQIDLVSLELIEGGLPVQKMAAVRRWATTRRKELLACWNKATLNEHPGKVE